MTSLVLFGYGIFSSPIGIVAVALVAFLFFGNRLPQVMRSLGKSVVEFKKGVNGIEEDLDEAVRSTDKAAEKKSSSESEI